MSRVICITERVRALDEGVPANRIEFVVSHGIDEDSGMLVVLPQEHPARLGARFDTQLHEWVLGQTASE